MIFIPKFAEEFVGKRYITSANPQNTWTAVGYGDNDANGNPYVVGTVVDSQGNTMVRTHRFDKDKVEFLP